MKKQFLIIGLIVGLFLVVSDGVAVAAQDVDPPTYNEDVLIKGDDTTATSQEATLKITQPVRNAPYRTPEGWEYRDAIPLLVETKKGLTETKDLNTILVIRSYGDSESELRFDNGDPVTGASYETDPSDLSSINAYIYTQGNDYTLRLVPGPFSDSALADIRIRKVVSNYSDTNLELQISAQTESDASLTFRKGSTQNAPPGDSGIDTAKIYRPADSDDLSIWMSYYDLDIMRLINDSHSIAMGYTTTASGWASTSMGYNTIASGNASVAIGMDTHASGVKSFAMGGQTFASGAHSVAMGYKITAAGDNSFAIGLNNSLSNTTISQDSTMAIMGGKVGIGTVSPQSALAVSGLPTAAPDASGTAGALCVTNDGNIWIDSDGTYDCQ